LTSDKTSGQQNKQHGHVWFATNMVGDTHGTALKVTTTKL